MLPTNLRIFHVADSHRWKNALETGEYSPTSYEIERFIHCCTLDQLPGVLSRYFSDQDKLLVLELVTSELSQKIIFENLENGTELFPHLYSSLPFDKVHQMYHLVRDNNQVFDLSLI